MERGILEADWKLFRQLQPLALDRFCQRVLAEVTRIAADSNTSNHDRYLAVFKLLQRRDEELADAFNARRRSTAVVQLARIQFQGLLTEAEFSRFSPETRASVQVYLEMWREG
jgi:hypothetical protein